MESLWPADLFKSTSLPRPAELLEEQARELERASDGRLRCQIDTTSYEHAIRISFGVEPRGRSDARFELLVVRCERGNFPCVLEDYHTGLGPFSSIADEGGLTEKLRKVLSHPRTGEIVRLIANEAGGPQRDSTPANVLFHIVPGRAMVDDVLLCKVRIGDVTGFVKSDEIHRFAKDPEEGESAYRSLGGQDYLTYVEFMGIAQVHVRGDDVEALMASARLALEEHATSDTLGSTAGMPGGGN